MNTTKFRYILPAFGLVLSLSMASVSTSHAGNGGAFIGGMIAGHVIHGFVERDRARTQAAVSQPKTVYVETPAKAPTEKTAEQRLAELDALKKSGAISEQEYAAKRKAIIDAL